MQKINMVDLQGQYLKIKEELNARILEVIDSGAFVKGPAVQQFEENLAKFHNCKHVISCGNGTDALQIAMMALGFKPGDEVITVSFTYVATVEVIKLLGLVPVFVDVDPDTFTIDVNQIEAKITDKTVAIAPVHLYGQSADMHPLMEIAKKHKLYVIEDNAQAIGADYIYPDGKKVKTSCIGDIGCTSFYPSKNLGAMGDGGAITTNDDDLATKLRQIANHGQSSLYQFDLIGVNSRLDGIQAALLDVKLSYLNDYLAARQEAAAYYDNAFKNHQKITPPKRAPYSTHVFHQYTLKLADDIDRDKLKNYLNEQGVPSMVYYPKPLHMHKAYTDLGFSKGDLPVSESLSERVISLPMHTELTTNQLDYIIEHVLKYCK
ncbi:MAG: DegT/DnrJ/EryC1/StrS family aminotransferase [Chitinophagaceae bacterium]|nr:MAG: DegT/DnrJ/EryC1/StrS family aminotransferase [Chitinophagaceae bacterium]